MAGLIPSSPMQSEIHPPAQSALEPLGRASDRECLRVRNRSRGAGIPHFLLSHRAAVASIPMRPAARSSQQRTKNKKHNTMKTQTILIALALALPAGFAGAQAPDAPPPGPPREGGARQPDRPPGARPEGARPQGRRDPAAPEGGPQQRGPRPEGGPDQGGRRFVPPIIAVIDANGDGEISADEMANAAAALKKLDKNGDGKVTMEELRPPPPQGGPEGAPRSRDGEGARPDGPPRVRDGEQPRNADRPRDGERPPGGDKPREGARPDGGPRDGGPRREPPRGDRPPGDAPRPDGEPRRPNPEG